MKLTATTIDADDVATLAAFWSAALGKPVEGSADEGYVFVGPEGDPHRICIQHT
ncbi:MAG: hypothetical protein JWO68_1558, partial [Actinomycetia bacterium]|nr:hypothetical protein [Actinomycetes bacterium]